MHTVRGKTTKQPLVSIVVLNWNGLSDTLDCLASIEELEYKNIQVIVVDNGSEEPIEKLESKKNIILIKNSVNKGFAGGENSALEHCKGDFILLLNNDATIHPKAITQALDTFSTDNKIAVVGSKSYSIDENGEKSLGFYSFQRIDPITADVSSYSKDNNIVEDTATVSGSGVIIRRSAIDAYGYFDERFFAYYEETDLFARYLRAGLRVVYDPAFVIWHKDGASTKNKRFMYYYLMLKNQFLFAYKNFDSKYLNDFKKTYYRNFRRSIWVYLKDRSKTEAIHKARVRSTIWNILNIIGTVNARRRTFSKNPHYSYSEVLFESKPFNASIILDATNIKNIKNIKNAVDLLVGSKIRPSEIIVVTNEAFDISDHTAYIAIRNIIHKPGYNLGAYDYGFMSSNTDILVFTNIDEVINCPGDNISKDLMNAYRSITRDESALVVNSHGVSKFKSDLLFTNGGEASLFAVRKTDLVNFLVQHDHIYNINKESLGEYINWCVMDCKPVSRVDLKDTPIGLVIHTPQSDYPVLKKPIKWLMKKILRKTHLSRVFSKIRKTLSKHQPKETPEGTKAIIQTGMSAISKKEILNTPIIINTRDRVEPLIELVSWLNSTGHTNILFVDNDSTYPELLEYFNKTPHQVVQLGRNGMHKAPWESFGIRFFTRGAPYIVSDPDILPTEDTPKNTIEHLYTIMEKYPSFNKVGVALKINDIPDHYQMKKSVIDWESRFWDKSIELEQDVYAADVDTTFALYKGNTWWFLSPSIRISGKYEMRHEPWYQDLERPTNDMMYYRLRASHEVSTWTKGKLPKHHIRALKKEGLL